MRRHLEYHCCQRRSPVVAKRLGLPISAPAHATFTAVPATANGLIANRYPIQSGSARALITHLALTRAKRQPVSRCGASGRRRARKVPDARLRTRVFDNPLARHYASCRRKRAIVFPIHLSDSLVQSSKQGKNAAKGLNPQGRVRDHTRGDAPIWSR